MEENQTNQTTPGAAIASLILGLVSFGFAWFGYGALISIITGIIGIILGVKANKIQQTGMATAGIVLSIIGIVLSIIVFVACVLCVGGLLALDAATAY